MRRGRPEGVLRKLRRLVRGEDWWQYKLPPILAVAYGTLLAARIAPAEAFGDLLALFGSAVLLSAAGYVANEASDVEPDLASGRGNRLAGLSPPRRWSLWLGLVIAGCLPWLIVGLSAPGVGLLAAIVLLPVAYSVRPLRLKERGLGGLVTDAAQAHAVPALFVMALLGRSIAWGVPLALAVAAWSFLVGMRGILIHQLWTLDADRASHTRTFVVERGVVPARRLATRVMFPLEISALLGVAILFSRVSISLPLILAAYALLDAIKLKWVWHRAFDPAPGEPGSYIVPFDLYEVWMPFLLALLLALRDPLYAVIPVLHVVFFYRGIREKAVELLRMIPSRSRLST